MSEKTATAMATAGAGEEPQRAFAATVLPRRPGVAGRVGQQGGRDLRRGRPAHTIAEAVTEERLRLAADVHDLIMQDLALALANARMLADGAAPEHYGSATVLAAERALEAARWLVEGLAEPERVPVVEAVLESARRAARGVPLSFDPSGAGDRDEADPRLVAALVHVAREAVTNAVKHAFASSIAVTLACEPGWRLRVRDDGAGFDPSTVKVGFGLSSMGRHAESAGGRLRVSSRPGGGTVVELTLS